MSAERPERPEPTITLTVAELSACARGGSAAEAMIAAGVTQEVRRFAKRSTPAQ
jgi:hypothetical protein